MREERNKVEDNMFPLEGLSTLDDMIAECGEEEEIAKIINDEYAVALTKYPRVQRWLLSCNGVGAFAIGSKSAIHAKQKSGKSYVSAILCAVVAGADFGSLHPGNNMYPAEERLKADNSTEKIPETIINRRILYLDTEQEVANCENMQRRIYSLLGLTFDKYDFRIFMRSLLNVPMSQRRNYIEWCLFMLRPCFVVIDGITDLLTDINNYGECQELSEWISKKTIEYNTHICMVIHDNWKGQGKDCAEMRGALGTEIRNRVAISMNVSKDDKGVFTVEDDVNRNRSVGKWCFILDNDGMPHPYNLEPQPEESKERDLSAVYDALYKLYADKQKHYSKEILQEIIKALNVGERMAKNILQELKKRGNLLNESKQGKFTYYDFYYGF